MNLRLENVRIYQLLHFMVKIKSPADYKRFMCREQVTTLRQQTAANVMDICWSRFDENLLAAGDFLWDTRTQVTQKHSIDVLV